MTMYSVTFEKTDQDMEPITRTIRLSSLITLLTEKINYGGLELGAVLAQIQKEGVYKGIHRNNIVTIKEAKDEV